MRKLAFWLVFAPLASPLAAQRHIGELRVLGAGAVTNRVDRLTGYSPPFVPSDGLGGGVASFGFLYRGLSAGPEVIALYGGERRVFSLGGVLRLGTTTGAIRPHGVLGAGRYAWDLYQSLPPGTVPFWGEDLALFTGSLGGGVTLGNPRGTLTLTIEARIHRNLQHEDFEAGRRMLYTLMAGTRVAW